MNFTYIPEEEMKQLQEHADTYKRVMFLEATSPKKITIKRKKKAEVEPEVEETPVEPIVQETPAEAVGVDEPEEADIDDGNNSIENIDTIVNAGAKKRGKKPADYTAITELRKEGKSRLAQYVGALLARSKASKPYWTIEDIKKELQDRGFVSEKFDAMLDDISGGKLSESELKEQAIEIKNDILKNIADFTNQVNDILKQKPSGNYSIPQEYTATQLKAKCDAIVTALKLLDEHNVGIDLNYNPERDNMFAYVQQIIMKIEQDIHIIKQRNDDEDNAQIRAEVNKQLMKIIPEINVLMHKPMLLPDCEEAITSVADLKKYFATLSSPEETERGAKLVRKYKKKTKAVAKNTKVEEKQASGGWDIETLKAIIHKCAMKVQQTHSSNTLESTDVINKIVSEIAKKAPALIELVEKEYDTQDGESELAGLIAKFAHIRENALGRKKGDIANPDAEKLLNSIFQKVKVS